jgi:hypothetical protein
MTMADHDDSTISSEAVVGSSDMATQVCSALFVPTLFLVDSHPVTQVGSRRMCLDPDVVPPLSGFRLYAILGVSLPAMFSLFLLYAFLKVLTVFDLFHSWDLVPSFYNSV